MLVALRPSRTRTTVPSRMAHDVLPCHFAPGPCVPVGAHLAPGAADDVLAHSAPEQASGQNQTDGTDWRSVFL